MAVKANLFVDFFPTSDIPNGIKIRIKK